MKKTYALLVLMFLSTNLLADSSLVGAFNSKLEPMKLGALENNEGSPSETSGSLSASFNFNSNTTSANSSSNNDPCEEEAEWRRRRDDAYQNNKMEGWSSYLKDLSAKCSAKNQEASAKKNADEANAKQLDALAKNGINDASQCSTILGNGKTAKKEGAPANNRAVTECMHLTSLAISRGKPDVTSLPSKPKKSMDGMINCDITNTAVQDYDQCVRAINYYNSVMIAEQAMMLEQKIRTDMNNKKIADRAQMAAQNGDYQNAALDGANDSAKHEKAIQTEKMIAYSTGVTALASAYAMIPGKSAIKERCRYRGEFAPLDQSDFNQWKCEETIDKFEGQILQNQEAKASLAQAIANLTAKGVAAGILMNQNGQKMAAIKKVKNAYTDDTTDMMVDRCAYFPNDPECKQAGQRISDLGNYGAGSFDLGGEGGSNSFNMSPDGESAFGDKGAAGSVSDANEVSGINSPFKDAAKVAKGIVNPAAAASVTPTGGAGGSGGSGGGGLGGGGAASLGGDLAGASKDDKPSQTKMKKVTGNYSNSGGGGFRGVSGSKDDANPFGSLFDQKGNGGLEQDDSIAAPDIDGASSELFQKISRRYGKVQSDKRIEANNLE